VLDVHLAAVLDDDGIVNAEIATLQPA